MDGKSGGQQPSTQTGTTNQTQNTNSTSSPNPFVQPQLQGVVSGLSDYYGANPNAPAYYPGTTVAQPSAATQSAQSIYGGIAANGLGYGIDPASRQLTADTLNGKYLDINNNPYFQGALAAGFAPQNRAFNDTILPNLRSQFEGSGRNLGGADMGTAQTALHNLSDSQANASATAANNAYGMERGLQQQTQQLLPSMYNMDLQRAGAMSTAGGMTDALNQQSIQDLINRYTYGQTAQPNYLSDQASRYLAAYPGGQTVGQGTSSGTSTMTGMPSTNPTASGIGAGMGIAGLGMQALPMFGFSDERLKKNVRPVGETYDGHKLYAYEFLGSSKPEIGVLAQEVERKDPAAVVTHPSGYKMVDYSRVAPGGLF